jgi:TP901 family phage tail tape measure protein
MTTQQETAVLSVFLNGEQAKDEIGKLEKHADSLRRTIKAVGKDSALGKKYSRELVDTLNNVKALQKGVVEVDKTLKNLSEATPKELTQTLRELNRQLHFSGIKRGSQEWQLLAENIRKVKEEQRKVNAELQVAESGLSGLSKGINKYFGAFAAGIASLSGFTLVLKNLVSEHAKLSDGFADVIKTTGLSRKEVQSLYDGFKSLDTRTSRERLLELARDAGKLGIQGAENIMRFVRAADQIDVALGEDLGEDAIKDIGKLISVLENVPVKLGQVSRSMSEMKLDDQMLAVGSAINSLGQSSTANEGYIVDFTQRLAGVSAQAQISVSDIMGYASVLDQSGQKVEMAATVLQNFITKIFEHPAKFAKMAGMEVSAFNRLLREDTNKAIISVIDALNKRGGFQQLVPVFKDMGLEGSRAIGVISALAKNTDKLREAQTISNRSFIEGTSITKEFQTKNESLAGVLDKLAKNIQGWFIRSGIVDWLSSVTSELEKSTRASKSATEQYDDQNSKVLNLVANIEPLLVRYDHLAAKTGRSAEENAELKRIITEITSVLPGAVSAVDGYGNAIAVSTARVREFIDAETARLGVVNKKAIEENSKLLSKLEQKLAGSKKIIEEISKTGTFKHTVSYDTPSSGAVHREVIATQEQVREAQVAYRQLLQDRKGYLAEIDRLSGQTLKQQASRMESDRKNRETQLKQEKAYLSKSLTELKKMADAGDELAKKVHEQKSALTTVPLSDGNGKGQKNQLQNALKNIEVKATLLRITALQEYHDRKSLEDKLLEIEKATVREKQKLYGEGTEDYVKYQEELVKYDVQAAQDKEKAEQQRREAIRALTEKYNKEAAQTDEQKKQQELDRLNELFTEELRMTEQYLKLKQGIENNYNSEIRQSREAAKKLLADNPETGNRKAGLSKLEAADLDAAEKAEQAQLDALQSIHDAEIASEIDFEKLRLRIEEKYRDIRKTKDKEEFEQKVKLAQFAMEQMNTLLSAYSSYVQAGQQAEEAAIEAKYDKQITAAGKSTKKVEKLEKQKEEELAKIRAEYEDKSFAIQIAQALASTATAAINAYASAAAIPIVGPIMAPIAAGVAVAAGMLQVATIKKQHEAAKASYYTGGYTPPGPWDEPQGTVHSGEFIGNRFAVNNPAVRKVFDIVEEAQKNNTVSSLTERDFARALDYREAENRHLISGISSAVSSPGSSRENETQILESIAGWLNRNAEVTDRLNKRLDEPFTGEVSITGRKGVKENLDRYEKMIKNASR